MLGKLKWLFIALVIGGPVLGWQGWQDRQTWSRLEDNGKTTAGVLEEGSVSKGRRGRKSYEFTVSYTPDGGTVQQQTFAVSRAFAERVTRGDQIVQDQCTVRYDPTEPAIAIIVDGSEDQRAMLPIGLGMFGVGAIGAFFMFRRKPAAAAAAG